MVTKPSTEQSQDFSIHNEDFPALPGPNYKDPTLSTDESKSVSVTQTFNPFSKPSDQLANHVQFFVLLSIQQNLNSSTKSSSSADGPKFPGDKTSAQNNNQQKKGIQVLPDGELLLKAKLPDVMTSHANIHTRSFLRFYF